MNTFTLGSSNGHKPGTTSLLLIVTGATWRFRLSPDPLLNERIVGLACLSTPFLTLAPRNLGPAGATALWWLPVVMIFYGGIFALEQATTSRNIDTLGPAVLFAALGSGFLMSRLLGRFSASVVESLRCPAVDPSKILILRTNGDEAAEVIAATHAISWATGRIWQITSGAVGRTVETVERWRRTLIRRWLTTTFITGFLISLCLGALLLSSPTNGPPWLESIFGRAVLSLLIIIATLVRGGLVAAFLGRIVLATIAAPFLILIALLGISVGS